MRTQNPEKKEANVANLFDNVEIIGRQDEFSFDSFYLLVSIRLKELEQEHGAERVQRTLNSLEQVHQDNLEFLFYEMYRNLFEVLKQTKEKRDRLERQHFEAVTAINELYGFSNTEDNNND